MMEGEGRYEYLIDTSILCFDIGLHCFRFLRILTFSWSRCVDYPSFIETASEQFAKELENRAINKRANYVKVYGKG